MNAVFLDTEGLDDLVLENLEKECSSLQRYPITAPDEVRERISGSELIITNKVKISRHLLEATPSVKLICVVATGTDVIDLKAAADFGVTVCNCRAYGTASVVQHVFSLLLALQTNLLSYHAAVQRGQWQQADQFCFIDYPITELAGKTLGIVGYGTLGRSVEKVAEAFGMEVIVARRPGNPPDDRPPLQKMLAKIDVLTLHCPLTEQTKNLIDAKSLALMKPTSLLINCARGGIVNEVALVDALQQKIIGGAAIDVLSIEPPKQSNPLLEAKLPNLIVTPHIAWAGKEARQQIIDQTTENIRAFKAGEPIRKV